MGTVRQLLLAAVLVSATQLGALSHAVADDDDAERASRWQALQQALFPGRSLKDGAGIVQLDAPPRALDAALVPIGISLSGVQPIKSVYLVIDGNPAPILRANRMMRGAALPAGKHTLVYTYEPDSFRIGAIVSLAGTIVLLILAWRSLHISCQLPWRGFTWRV